MKPWENGSGCSDFTAYNAIKNVTAEEQKIDRAARMVVTTIKNVLELVAIYIFENILFISFSMPHLT